MNGHRTLDNTKITWGYGLKSNDIIDADKEQIGYDANGNIRTYKRNSARSP